MTDDPIEVVVETIASTAPEIQSGLVSRRGYAAEENPTGDRQLDADVYADELLEERLLDLECVGGYASEERAETIRDDGGYHVGLDPLDGSSNLRSNNSMGTIFGVYDEPLPAGGESIVASGYVLYGPITTMVVARGGPEDGTVTEYLLEDGTRRTLEADLHLPSDPVVYGFGGRRPKWSEAFREYVDAVAEELKLRYSGAMIGDMNQVLTYGGLFGYPGLSDRPDGKLRKQFEGIPIGYIVETAGGASSDGAKSLLEGEPAEIHECSPTFIGDPTYIDRLEDAIE
ncbi:MAG: fructose-1,6-bisphosphatase [Natronomonas sp.]